MVIFTLFDFSENSSQLLKTVIPDNSHCQCKIQNWNSEFYFPEKWLQKIYWIVNEFFWGIENGCFVQGQIPYPCTCTLVGFGCGKICKLTFFCVFLWPKADHNTHQENRCPCCKCFLGLLLDVLMWDGQLGSPQMTICCSTFVQSVFVKPRK